MNKIIKVCSNRLTKGRNLTELNVVLSIISILGLSAAFHWNELLSKYRLEGFVQVMNADLKFARSQAVTLNQTVTVAFTNSGYAICSPDCTSPTQTYKVVDTPHNISLQASNANLSFYPNALVVNTMPAMSTASTITALIHNNTYQLDTLIATSGRIEMCSRTGVTTEFAACTT